MKKVAVIYWSSTGNTQSMAKAVAEGVKAAGAEMTMFEAADFSTEKLEEYDAFAFGCPAAGAEELEESEFEPMFAECEEKLSGKPVALFGSYGWGDGQWMRDWEDRCKEKNIELKTDSVICQEAPEEDTLEECRKLGKALAE